MAFGLNAKGAIHPDNLEDNFSQYSKVLNVDENKLTNIGHQMGDPEHYPISVKGIKEGTAHDICHLMSKSFDIHNFQGIELDVQLYPKDNGTKNSKVVITHDMLKIDDIDKSVKDYFEKNNLKSLLHNFIEKGYFREKYIFIELKEDRKMSNDYKKELREEIVRTLEETISEHKLSMEDEDLLKSHIGFLSFGYDNLANMQELMKEKDSYTRHFIASTDKFLGHLVHRIPAFSYIRCINDEYIEKLKSSSRLNSIWFDPIGIKNVEKFMRKFDDRKDADPMKFYISTYKLSQQDFIKKLKKGDIPNQNIGGLIFDVKE